MREFCGLILIWVLFNFLSGCKDNNQQQGEEAIASVGNSVLLKQDVKAIIPSTFSSADSMLMAENYIKRWVKDALLYDVANKNLDSDRKEIEKLVESYRRSLIIYRYKELLTGERLNDDISEEEIQAYYEANKEFLFLDHDIIKGLFVKIPNDVPGLDDLRKWCKTSNDDVIEKIEKYCLQNANIYDYFYDHWLDFNKVVEKMPLNSNEAGKMMKSGGLIEVSDSSFCYFLSIRKCIHKGSVPPYEYVYSNVKEMLLSQRKMDFIKKFEEDLYNEAIRRGEVKFYSE